MTAQEQQDERVVLVGAGTGFPAAGGTRAAASADSRSRRDCSLRSRSIILCDATRIRHASRDLRGSAAGPLRGGDQQRLLDGVLGDVEMSVTAHQRAEYLRRELAQQALDGTGVGHADDTSVGGSPGIGRTSIASPVACAMRPAISIARSWLATSTMAKLASTSLNSA